MKKRCSTVKGAAGEGVCPEAEAGATPGPGPGLSLGGRPTATGHPRTRLAGRGSEPRPPPPSALFPFDAPFSRFGTLMGLHQGRARTSHRRAVQPSLLCRDQQQRRRHCLAKPTASDASAEGREEPSGKDERGSEAPAGPPPSPTPLGPRVALSGGRRPAGPSSSARPGAPVAAPRLLPAGPALRSPAPGSSRGPAAPFDARATQAPGRRALSPEGSGGGLGSIGAVQGRGRGPARARGADTEGAGPRPRAAAAAAAAADPRAP